MKIVSRYHTLEDLLPEEHYFHRAVLEGSNVHEAMVTEDGDIYVTYTTAYGMRCFSRIHPLLHVDGPRRGCQVRLEPDSLEPLQVGEYHAPTSGAVAKAKLAQEEDPFLFLEIRFSF
jgi:hypothetical protein